ncbi:ABC transporter ATP-binding protein [Azospirillum sp. SYSU D00513]|uniref:energy-coupling factor ABC transporter ATP-binding protein n=1 Tax=Azospirillum sp. SYSU D00513 TaxID=2812561 RepID=UPI001A9666AB|nr:ABC transporter ATP-binding protein [Azospirillum sp. SYSU D00513]
MTEQGIHLQSVTLRRGAATLFDGLSLSLTEPRIGLVGDNGAGKSSLLRVACGLLAPDSGSVTVHGADAGKERTRLPGLVGILFQNPDDQIIFPTVVEELAFSLTAQGEGRREARRRASAYLGERGLDGWADRAVGSLSQGQRQRLCLMALDIMGPRTLLLDEPFASLDLPAQARLVRHVRTTDRQVVLSSHVLEPLLEFERVLWLDGGRIRADGPGREVCAAYRADVEDRAERAGDAQLLS